MQYIVLLTIDRYEPGEDVTDKYQPAVLARLVAEGYLELVDEELPFVPDPVKPKRARKTVEHFVDDEPAQD